MTTDTERLSRLEDAISDLVQVAGEGKILGAAMVDGNAEAARQRLIRLCQEVATERAES
jgi:hypothetical protein